MSGDLVPFRLAGTNVLVAGAGVTGRSVASALSTMNAKVTVTDVSAERLSALADLDVTLTAGLTSVPPDIELVVTSPGWRPDTPLLADAVARRIEVIGDVELAWRAATRPPCWLAVTGTNGKTTTVGMLASILRSAGLDAVACGNIGLPLLDAAAGGHEVLAVELSSFQLHWSPTARFTAAVVLNVSEDHLDWHGSVEAYAADKGAVYRGDPVAVFNMQDAWSVRLSEGKSRRVGFTLDAPDAGQIGVVEGTLVDRAFGGSSESVALGAVHDVSPGGQHNVANALAAAALARAHGVAPAAVRDGLRAYQPPDHRATLVAEISGVTYINDSKATNAHAAAASLRAYPRVVWIAGGLLKGASADALVAENADRLVGVVLLGADREVIGEALSRHAPDVPVRRVGAGDDKGMTVMSLAVREATAMARPGDVVLLAPAAASMDMFDSYLHRGQAFAAAVHELSGGAGS